MIFPYRFISCFATTGLWRVALNALAGILMFLAGPAVSGAVIYPFEHLPELWTGENETVQFNVDLSTISAKPAEIKMAARSSNLRLNSPTQITFSQQGGILNVALQPATCQAGVSTIDLIASDGTSTNLSTFQIIVSQPLGQFPLILGLPDDVMIGEDQPLDVHFSIVSWCSSNALTVSASSSTPGLFVTNRLELIGSNTNWLLRWIPEKGITGQSAINVTVSDGTTSSASGFVVRVGQSNALGNPFLHPIADQTAREGTAIIIPLTLDNVAVAELNPSQFSAEVSNTNLLPNAGVAFIKTGTNVSLRLLPTCGPASSTVRVSFRAKNELTMSDFILAVTGRERHLDIEVPATVEGYANDFITVVPIVHLSAACAPVSTFLNVRTSNPILFPAANVIITGAGTNWTVKLIPSIDQSGESVVSFGIGDSEGYYTTTDTRVIVHPVNDQPRISSIGDQKVNPGESLAILFSISDPDNSPSQITARAYSSNTNMVADADLQLSNQGTNYFLALRSQTNITGRAEITVQAWDPSRSTAAVSFFVSSGAMADLSSVMSIQLQPDLRFRVEVSGHPGATNHIETSSDLIRWQMGAIIQLDAGGKAAWTNAMIQSPMFFRLQN